MRSSKMICALICAASMVSTPVMAESLSPGAGIAATKSVKRVAPKVKKESKQLEGIPTVALVVGALVVIGGIILLTDDDNPSSP